MGKAGSMRVLVAGGAGFVGGHVCEELLRRGHRVSVLDNMSSGRDSNIPDGAKLRARDITKWRDVEEVVEEFRPEVIIHLAAQADVVKSCEDPHTDAETNIIGLLNVLKSATVFGVRRIVFASSGGTVYGPRGPIPTPETTPLDPICPYGISKAAGEWHLRHWAERNNREWVALRLGNVYGPRDRRGVVTKFARMRLRGEVPEVRNGRRDYVSVYDVAYAFCQAAEVAGASGAYNVGGGRFGQKTQQVLWCVDEVLGTHDAPRTNAPLVQGEVPTCVLDSHRARDELFGLEYERRPFYVARTVVWVREDEAKHV